MTDCSNESLAARWLAQLDEQGSSNHSASVLNSLHPDEAIHYASEGSRQADKRVQLYARLGISNNGVAPDFDPIPAGATDQQVAWNKLKKLATTTVKGHTDLDIRPDEVLGDDVVHALFEPFNKKMEMEEAAKNSPEAKNQKENPQGWSDKRKNIVDDSGYTDALQDAYDLIQDKYGDGQDPARYEYGMAFLDQLKGPKGVIPVVSKFLAGNLAENATQNRFLLAYRHSFDTMRTVATIGPGETAKGLADFRTALKANNPEATQFNPKDHGVFNALHGIGKYNRGATYFAAKNLALKSGMAEPDAVKYATRAVSALQYSDHPLNQPRAFWKSESNPLTLLKWHLADRRWYLGQWGNILDGAKPGASPEQKQLATRSTQTMLIYLAAHGLVFGASSDIPEEFVGPLEFFSPNAKAFLTQIDRFSVSGTLNIDAAPITRQSLTPAGTIARMGIQFQQISKVRDNLMGVINHPTSAKIMANALTSVMMVLPAKSTPKAVQSIGIGNIGDLIKLAVRLRTHNYEHTTLRGKHYNASPAEEIGNSIRGGHESLSRDIQKAKLDQQSSGHASSGLHLTNALKFKGSL